ncbi:MAG: SDR family oxidoreductase [Deltaproteobacteria bacterium]|nr:SDR family oxidoreductase [Deltaproteobacteria bacterium]
MKLEPGMQVFITGAASGIGRACALAMAERRLRLCLTDIDAHGLAETCRLAEAAGGTVAVQRVADVTQFDAIARLAEEIIAAHGAVDVLMNVAGVAVFGLPEDMRHADWRRVIDVNLYGTIHTIEAFMPAMIAARRGHVVNIASLAGLVGMPWHSAYITSKWAVMGLSEALRCDLHQHGVGVSVICPGAVATPLRYSSPILGIDPQHPGLLALRQRFDQQAVTPERVAALACAAVERNRFLVRTSWDVVALHALQRFTPRLCRLIMNQVGPRLSALRTDG